MRNPKTERIEMQATIRTLSAQLEEQEKRLDLAKTEIAAMRARLADLVYSQTE
jgi:hypothetical protein